MKSQLVTRNVATLVSNRPNAPEFTPTKGKRAGTIDLAPETVELL